ncbi:glycoside hydrolase family 3 protein [Stereum hirsutum FP-91666 SS1]|uniref:glycoside hydrolase family 3 protein n=1 Tax=Stereum hirsutum (strain FP-91666) TaxID=721885 RepID=UPI000444982F|nr:glycoside hydrolase family 3 protein [Stereum hirsutum FP-91666 SS1]EIM81964.1 glycoside hydrolase family 3 protein [Stereum hirsutum FP-91666 SS1]
MFMNSSPVVDAFGKADLNAVISKLSTAEKISLLAGPDWWTTTLIDRVGVPRIKCSDGPNGVRGSSHFLPTPAATIPCATALAATYDTDLIAKVGGLLAEECEAKGSSLLLAPTCNIQRNPLNGRAFESFSEDPFLSGMMSSAVIHGLQDGGVGATIKHFVGNDMEDERFSVNVVIPDRALREIYLMPFHLAQKLAKPWAFMTSYSKLNGTHCSEHEWLLKDLLRGEWGFDGLVMSDWSGTYSTDLAINAGLDLEMPGPTRWRANLVTHLMHAGKITLSSLNDRVYAVLKTIQRSILASPSIVSSNHEPERTLSSPTNNALNRLTAASAVVLLKNTAKILPLSLSSSLKSIAVIGPNAKTRTVSGGGSAFLTSAYVITPLEGIQNAVKEAGDEVEISYATGCSGYRYLPMLDGWITTADGESGWTAEFYNEPLDSGASPIATHVLLSTRLRINDEKPEGLAEHFYIAITGYIVAEESGPFELGVSLVGRGRVFVDGKLVVDNGIDNKQTPGPSFYGLGTIEEVGEVQFVKGQKYEVKVEYTNVPLPLSSEEEGEVKQPPLMMAALRVGAAPKIAPEQAIVDAVELAKSKDAVIVVIGTNMDWEAEASDREGLGLPGRTDELVEKILAVRPDAIIVNQSGSSVAFPWVEKATTLCQSWFGGNETGNGIADVIFGKVNPSARMPLTFPKNIEDCTAHLNWGAENGKVTYGEGIFVGYRGYEETKREPIFHFGAGESYTTFEWTPITATLSSDISSAETILATVRLTVTNTGHLPGSEVVQLYVSDPHSTLRRPKKELKGFKKVGPLQPGESKEVEIVLDKMAFSYWDDVKDSWVAEKGEFVVKACGSADERSVRSKASLSLEKTYLWRGL